VHEGAAGLSRPGPGTRVASLQPARQRELREGDDDGRLSGGATLRGDQEGPRPARRPRRFEPLVVDPGEVAAARRLERRDAGQQRRAVAVDAPAHDAGDLRQREGALGGAGRGTLAITHAGPVAAAPASTRSWRAAHETPRFSSTRRRTLR